MTDAGLMATIWSQLQAQSGLELVAVVLAIAYVWLAARQNIWCWPCAFISTGIYVHIFWQVWLPFHAVLNGYYLLMAIYGLYQWRATAEDTKPIIRWPIKYHFLAIIGLTLASAGLIASLPEQLDGDFLYLDAMITIFSVFTTVLVAHKVLENWLYWIVINSFAAYLYFAKDLALTGLLFIAYIVFAIYGYLNWRRVQPRRLATQQQA